MTLKNLLAIIIIFNMIACSKKTNHETHYIETEESNNNVDKVFSAAKKFADGTNTIAELEQEFNQLNAEELKALDAKRDGGLFFSLLITVGIASEQSNSILTKFFEANPIQGSTPKDHEVAAALVKAILTHKRKTTKIPDSEYREISLVLARYPEMINNFTRADGSFDNQEFTDFIEHTDNNTASSIMLALEKTQLKTWVDWILIPANRQKAPASFKSLYTKMPDQQKVKLRNQLVASSPDLSSLLDQADDFGIKAGLASDEYALSSNTPGTRYQGSLLSVLTHRAVRDDKLADLRIYAQKIKNAINNTGLYENMLNNQIREPLKKALEAKKRQWFSNYFLAADSPQDLIQALEDPNSIDNNQLNELYGLVIDSPTKALELSQSYDSKGQRFIHLVVERPADSQSAELINHFLNSIGPDQEQEQLNDTGKFNNIKKPITLLAENSDTKNQPSIKTQILDRLLKHAPAAALDTLSDEKIKESVEMAVKTFLSGGNGAADFKLMYEKITDQAKQELMRTYLLEDIINKKEPWSMRRLLSSMTDAADYWGLRQNLASDNYRFKTNHGLLLAVLSSQAKEQNDYVILRVYAQIIKSALANKFEQQFNDAKPILAGNLSSIQREDFADYYLAHETPKNVYQAAAKPESSLSNSTLKELYGLIIGDISSQAQLLADEAAAGGDRFIHRLLKRSIDSKGDLLSILISFFSALGLEQEKAQLDGAIKIISDHERPNNDNKAQKTLVLERLARNIMPSNLVGVSGVDLADQVPLLLNSKLTFKKIYSLYNSTTPEAQLMRSKLLQEVYNQSSNKTKNLLKEITDSTDPWGLRNGLDQDTYEIDRNPISAGKISGSLLYVLSQGAIDDNSATANSSAYNSLSEYAALIKNSLTSSIYENHVKTKIYQGQTILTLLKQALPENKSYFANTYLALDAFTDIITAVKDSANFSNQQLKNLYILVINNDKSKTKILADQDQGIFIHDLLKRTADIYTRTILEKYLDNLDNNLVSSQVITQIAGKYPINYLAEAKSGDDPSSKAIMFGHLLKNDDGTAAASIDAAELAKTRFFSAGLSAAPVFKKLYGLLQPQKQQSLRSALLADAYQVKKVPELVNQITDISDTWGLKTGLTTDNYNSSDHKGPLLHILIELAIDDNSFDALKLSAEKIRALMEQDSPASYAGYAVGLEAYPDLAMFLDSNPGFAQYYLALDKSAPDINIDLVFDCAKIDKNSKLGLSVLNWLYQEVVDNTNINNLLAKTDDNSRNFFHLLSLKNTNNISLKILKDLISKSVAKNLDLDSLIAGIDKSGKSSLHYLLDNKRTDKGSPQLLEQIVSLAQLSPSAIKNISTSTEVNLMLKAVSNKGSNQDLDLLFNNITNKAALAEWCAENHSNTIGAKFLAGSNQASASEKITMLNHLVKKAYELGYQQSTIKGGLSDVANLINEGFFDQDTLINKVFDPFKTKSESSLLEALINEAKPNQESSISPLISALKAKFNDQEWKTYLTNNSNIIANLILYTPDKNIETAHKWLQTGF